MYQFLNKWESLASEQNLFRKKRTRYVIVCAAFLVWGVIAMALGSFVFLILMGGPVFETIAFHPFNGIKVMEAFLFVEKVYLVLPWALSMAALVYILIVLRHLFLDHKARLQKMREDGRLTKETLLVSRREFLDMCDLVDMTDSLASLLNGANFVFNLPLCLFVARSLVFVNQNAEEDMGLIGYTQMGIWLLLSLFQLIIPTYAGCRVHTQVNFLSNVPNVTS